MSKKSFKVLILTDLAVKAFRDRLLGTLRFCSKHPEINIVNINDERKTDRTPTDIDAVIRYLPSRKIRLSPKTFVYDLMDYESIDDEAIAHAVANLLIRRGHKHFAFVGSSLPDERQRSDLRGKAFSDYLKSQGFDCAVHSNSHDSTQITAKITGLVRFLQGLPKPCGVMLYADNCAMEVLYACQSANISIPEQIALVGVDNDTSICENVHPTLSSVWPDFEYAGYHLAENLLAKLNGEIKTPDIISYGVRAIIERDSSQDLNCGGLLVCRIDDYIKENFTQRLTLGMIARRFNVSGRLIEMRFRNIRGYSVHRRIESLRLEKARHLLRKDLNHSHQRNRLCLRLWFRSRLSPCLCRSHRHVGPGLSAIRPIGLTPASHFLLAFATFTPREGGAKDRLSTRRSSCGRLHGNPVRHRRPEPPDKARSGCLK